VNGVVNAVNGAASFVSRNVGTLTLTGKTVAVEVMHSKAGQGALYIGIGVAITMLASHVFKSKSMPAAVAPTLKIGFVNFKDVIEKSKLGIQERENYENMKSRIETVIADKEREFNEKNTRLQNELVRATLSPETRRNMEEDCRTLEQELAQGRNQYYQALQQANRSILRKVEKEASKAAATVASTNGIDVILNDENTFYKSPSLDRTEDVIAEMDQME